MWVTSSLTRAITPTAVALGNFDGVHRGHQQVIQPVLNQRGDLNVYATVVTFNPHPREFFTGQRRGLLTPLNQKVQQLILLGVQQLVLLPFDRELADLTPQEFVEKILVQQLHPQMISVGQDFRFGRGRSGTATDLKVIAASFGIPVNIVPLYTCESDSSQEMLTSSNNYSCDPGATTLERSPNRISSSSIRQALEQGNMERAIVLLGRPYSLTGCVVQGQQLGRTIGFPTANLQLPSEKFLPRQGVYAVGVFIEPETTTKFPASEMLVACLPPPVYLSLGVMNIGCRPTVNGTHPSVEVHLLDWSGDLYGKTLTVQLKKFLRPEQKFASLEALKQQIEADCNLAKALHSDGNL